MSDPGTLALGIAAVSLSISIISLTRRPGPKAPTAAMCPCGHGISYHTDKGTGPCKVVVERVPIKWASGGRAIEWKERLCSCLMYAGPELLRGLTSGGFHLPEIHGEKE